MTEEEKRIKKNVYANKWYKKNKKKSLESQKKYRENNKEKISLSQKKWRLKNKNRLKKSKRDYYLKRINNLPDKVGRGWIFTYCGSGKSPHRYIYKPKHPNCTTQGYVAEHRLVMEDHIDRYLKKEEIVHHIDHDGLNNKINNLKIMSQSEHSKLHIPYRDKKTGRFVGKL